MVSMSRLSSFAFALCILLSGIVVPLHGFSQEESGQEEIEEITEVRQPDYYNREMVEGRRLRGSGEYHRALTKLDLILQEGDP